MCKEPTRGSTRESGEFWLSFRVFSGQWWREMILPIKRRPSTAHSLAFLSTVVRDKFPSSSSKPGGSWVWFPLQYSEVSLYRNNLLMCVCPGKYHSKVFSRPFITKGSSSIQWLWLFSRLPCQFENENSYFPGKCNVVWMGEAKWTVCIFSLYYSNLFRSRLNGSRITDICVCNAIKCNECGDFF